MRNVVLSAAIGLLMTASVSAQDKLKDMIETATFAGACFAIYPDIVSEEASTKMLSMARAQGNKKGSYNNVMEQVHANMGLAVISIAMLEDARPVCQQISDYMYLTYEVDYE